jgi:hypothetical protein
MGELGGGDEKGEAAFGGDQTSGDGEDGWEAFDGAKGDDVERDSEEDFGAGGEYIDVCQCKGARDFAEESGFLVVGLDEGQRDVRSPEFDRDAGESGTGAEVGDCRAVVGPFAPLRAG